MKTTTLWASSVAAASDAPSSTRWGECVSRNPSFRLAGSLSDPLPTTTGRRDPSRTPRHFFPTGNQAPPWPRRPLESSSSSSVDRALRNGSVPQCARCASRSTTESDDSRALNRRGNAGAWDRVAVEEAIRDLTLVLLKIRSRFH